MNRDSWLLLILLGGAVLLGSRRKGRKRRSGQARRRSSIWDRWFYRGPGTCYRIKVRHPRSGRTVTGYVGQTRRPVQVRIDEHLLGTRTEAPKVWADTVVSWDVIWSSERCTQSWLDWRERFYIVTRRPLYNVQWNTNNRRRIEPHRARLQRARRSGAPRRGWMSRGGRW